jgi:hypothetical protein
MNTPEQYPWPRTQHTACPLDASQQTSEYRGSHFDILSVPGELQLPTPSRELPFAMPAAFSPVTC